MIVDPPPFKKEPQNIAILRGPFSPLEMYFSSLCHSAHLKQVIIDGGSLNSVTLDQDPFKPASRMLVAANVAVAQRSGNILARYFLFLYLHDVRISQFGSYNLLLCLVQYSIMLRLSSSVHFYGCTN